MVEIGSFLICFHEKEQKENKCKRRLKERKEKNHKAEKIKGQCSNWKAIEEEESSKKLRRVGNGKLKLGRDLKKSLKLCPCCQQIYFARFWLSWINIFSGMIGSCPDLFVTSRLEWTSQKCFCLVSWIMLNHIFTLNQKIWPHRGQQNTEAAQTVGFHSCFYILWFKLWGCGLTATSRQISKGRSTPR